MSFPTRGQIYQEPLDRIRSTLGRVSLDTFYQVVFSFGKDVNWFEDDLVFLDLLNAGLDETEDGTSVC